MLFTIGLTFMSVAAVDYIMGSSRIFIKLPAALEGQFDFFGVGIGRYRLIIIVICGLLTIALQLILAHTRFGSRLRAAVDDPRAASGLGINVPQVFAFTFAFGCGLAGLGGALGAEILGLDPYFPLKFMIYFLIVVTVGGTSSITGPFLASLLLGIGDVAGKYYVPKLGRVRHLHHHDRDPDLASARPVRPRRRAVRRTMTAVPNLIPCHRRAPAGARPKSRSGSRAPARSCFRRAI